jgi:hypothetical protein
MAGTLSRGFAGIGGWLHKEFVAIWPVFLFLFFGFVFLILLIKLTLTQFSPETMMLRNPVIRALLGAKAVLILDETPLGVQPRPLSSDCCIAAKVLFYC